MNRLSPEDIVGRRCNELSGMGSEIRRMFLLGQSKKQQNPALDLIDLSLGNPDLEPPSVVDEAIIEVLHTRIPGAHRYMDNAGYPEVRAFIASELTRSEEVPVEADSVFMSCGASGALQVVMRTVLDAGDEAILFAPFFVEYVPYLANYGAVPVFVKCDENHLPNLEEFKKKLTQKTRLVIINSPNNPTGVVYSEALMNSLMDILKEHRKQTGRIVHVISDEPYNRLIFGSEKNRAKSILAKYDAAWLIRSHSKDLGLAGERIGYVAWNAAMARPETLGALRNSARALGFVNAPALMQRILPKIFSSSVNVREYEQRCINFVQILRAGGISVVSPGGSFFVFPKSPIPDDRAFCEKLVDHGVLCVPGIGFGVPGYFRASLTQPLPVVEEAARRIVACLA